MIFLVLAASSLTGLADAKVPVSQALELKAARQRLAGIRAQPIQPRSFSFKFPVPAQVIDPIPLLEAGNRFAQLSKELASQAEITAMLHQRIARLEPIGQALRRDPLEQARQAWLTAKTRLETLQLEAAALENRLQAEWGPVLSAWVKAETDQLKQLARNEIFLLRLILPHDKCTDTAVLERQGKRFPLQYLSPSPKSDPVFSGAPHFFLTAAQADLRLGERLTAWLIETGTALPIPAQAVVWYGGQKWIFVQTGTERFERRRLTEWRERGQTVWVQAGLAPGEQVVTQGAQLLLAEELKAQVPEED